ncbi:hypothetical protein BSL78_28580 [Apostichopus japonicus]|uniref:MYND-type domain-containing protein n=1 Tax=Stichopus japonicus TaxID=307972 RepID=A0A2G8JFR4_STIJA|nr:hypothetical protein BSL78_28580 [Apostichopus japonicus]
MDVKKGYCWRCNQSLRGAPKKCTSCVTAEYCSTDCLDNDKVRHESVECPNWSAKPCGSCKKIGALFECCGCLSIMYCNDTCQKLHWESHKRDCVKWKKKAKKLASILLLSSTQDYPFYFSNSFANDLLNLESNEMKDKNDLESAQQDYSILLPACGDLRQMIQTVYSLPVNFTGSLKFVLNDIDPFVMARNVLLLYMISSSTEVIAPKIASIWLSLHLSEEEYTLLRASLHRLIEMDATRFKESTSDVVDVSAHSYNAMREVWMRWGKLQCHKGSKDCIKLEEERQNMVPQDEESRSSVKSYVGQVPRRHAASIDKWFSDGVIMAKETQKDILPYYNCTFTGRKVGQSFFAGTKIPSDITFNYCVNDDCVPFQMWDYLDMIKNEDCDSVTEMCHAFTTKCVTITTNMIKQRRMKLGINISDFLRLQPLLPRNAQFDRIFASNLIDYHKISVVLETLEPLLSNDNPHAVLLTETINWYGCLEKDADLPTDPHTRYELLLRNRRDSLVQSILADARGNTVSIMREFYNNMIYFVTYLRARRIHEPEEPYSGQSRRKPPTWLDLRNWSKLNLRDFRSGRNKVVPLCRRVNARTVSRCRGSNRILEWYREDGTPL